MRVTFRGVILGTTVLRTEAPLRRAPATTRTINPLITTYLKMGHSGQPLLSRNEPKRPPCLKIDG